MTEAQVFKHYGGVRETAEALKITTQAVYAWKGKVPRRAQQLIEADTGGMLKADRAQKRA